jgi:DNA-binding IclR family transcriptional regulator
MARKKDPASASVRSFAVLDALVADDGPVALADLAKRVGLPKPTVHRLLAQLEAAQLVGREPGGRRFSVGARLSALALRVLSNSTHRGARRAILQGLVDELGETCNLTMLDGAQIVYLDRVETPSPLRLNLQSGSRVPLHCTASGKLLLALLPAPRRARLVRQLKLDAQTPNTLTDRAALEAALKRVRRERLSVDAEEFITGLVCVAVPILAADGHAIAAVAMQAPVARMPLERALGHASRLREAATALGATFAD